MSNESQRIRYVADAHKNMNLALEELNSEFLNNPGKRYLNESAIDDFCNEIKEGDLEMKHSEIEGAILKRMRASL